MDKTNDAGLSKEEIERYCRQMLLSEISSEGQHKIKNSKILVVGAGGLGSPCLLYLAGAGVGTIGIVDGDTIDTSNLHRQIIHTTVNKGMSKSKSAAEAIKLFNPLTNVIYHEEHLSRNNGLTICSNYDMLIDCSDNPGTRYLINDLAVILKIPLVSGSAVKWEGQLTVYVNHSINNKEDNTLDIPCYRCMFPKPTPVSAVCNCSDAGVFGPVPGVIGTMQASEAIKLLIGAKDKILSKRMLFYDGLEMIFKVFKLRSKKPDCIVCSSESKITIENISSYDYDEFVNPQQCRIPLRVEIPSSNNLKWDEFLKQKKEGLNLIDVRSSEQYNIYNFPEFKNIPLKDLKFSFEKVKDNFPIDKDTYIMCRRGNNSTHAVKFLLENGYTRVFNIEGGLLEYKKSVDPNCPEY